MAILWTHMDRLRGMNDQTINRSYVNDITYGPADEMLQMNTATFTETRSYNANLQLTELVSGAGVHLKYNYAASQNNEQIVSQQDLVSGETISYQYDSLKRLVQASAAGDPSGSWSQNFAFDGFGNLTNKTSTNAPQLNVAVDWATNRIQSFSSYDANGNMTGYAGDGYSYDLQNRMIQATVSGVGTVVYGYDTTNHRIYKGGYNSGTYSAEEFYFYGVEGHKYGTWQINPSSGVLLQASVTKQWFGGRLVSPEDRLGSKGRYFAFGEERTNITPANPPNDQEKFATYTRDAATGLDYANQRYFFSIVGRFTRPDPYGDSAEPSRPQSLNRYAYVENDPAGAIDPQGLNLQNCGPDWVTDASLVGPCSTQDGSGGGEYGGNGVLGSGGSDSDAIDYGSVLAAALLAQSGTRPEIQCNIQVVYSPAGSGFDPFVHTAVAVQESLSGFLLNTTYLEAGPKAVVSGGTQDATIAETLSGLAYLDRSGGKSFMPYYQTQYNLQWQSGFAQSNCLQDQVLRANALRFPNNTFRYSLLGGGPFSADPGPNTDNSNSFTATLLSLSGVMLPFTTQLELAIAAPGFTHLLTW